MDTRHFFVTGANGVLGLEILPRILRDLPGARITMLLRPKNGEPIHRRLESARSWITAAWPDADVRAIEAVAGDAGFPSLGLDTATAVRLQRTVTDVIHGAATTRLDDAPERARRINVLGTVECLRFALSCGNLRRFAHISTAHVCGDREGVIRETELRAGQRFLNTYETSKYEAEVRVRERKDDLPVTVFRPSIIVGDSRTGRIASFGSIYRPLRRVALETLHTIPCAEDTRLDLVPVDYVAESLVRLIDEPRAAGEVYHLCAGLGRRTPVRQLLETAIRVAGRDGEQSFRFHPARDEAARSGFSVFLDYLHLDREFCDARARAHLGSHAPRRPHPDHFLGPLLDYCRRRHWGARPLPEVESCSAPRP